MNLIINNILILAIMDALKGTVLGLVMAAFSTTLYIQYLGLVSVAQFQLLY